MSYSEPAIYRTRRLPRILVHGLVLAVVAIFAIRGYELVASPPSKAASHSDAARSNLDPGLLDALNAARADAVSSGLWIVVKSGWRSPEQQEQLLQEAIAKYGSETEAARWVATPETSPHVSGDAVDVGPDDAAAWLSTHGAAYGLCQIYANEPWHYELRPEAVDEGCPPMYADPTHDPRMQR